MMTVVQTPVLLLLVLEERVSVVGVRVMGQHVWLIVNVALVRVLLAIQTLDFVDILRIVSKVSSQLTVRSSVHPIASWKNV